MGVGGGAGCRDETPRPVVIRSRLALGNPVIPTPERIPDVGDRAGRDAKTFIRS